MKNPFYITDELTLSRTEIETTNHEELLKQIKRTMALMGLKHQIIAHNILFFSHSKSTRGLVKASSFRNVMVTVDFNEDNIKIHFKSSLKKLILLALIPILIFLIPKQNLLPSFFLYLYPLYLLVAFAITKISLGNTRYAVKVFLLKEF